MASSFNTVRILGLDFFDDRLEAALRFAREEGGLVLAPSGPGLADLGRNPHYDRALREADLNLIDSGYLALLWKRRTGRDLARHSGLKFLAALLDDPAFRANPKQLWVLPSRADVEAARRRLAERGAALGDGEVYEAPHYREQAVRDEALLALARERRPDYIIIGIAGGKQEVLGHWLRERLEHRPAIVCIGAAIAFLSGRQAHIPPWADRIFIGWLLRILADPRTFLPRYWKARKLSRLVDRYGEEPPPESAPDARPPAP